MDTPATSIGVWITAINGFVAIILALINRNSINSNARKADEQHEVIKAKVDVVENNVNGKMQQLLDVTGDARQAIGNLAGRAEEKSANSENSGSSNVRL